MQNYAFNDLIDYYNAVIDWKRRLANEEPLYRMWFLRSGVKRVVDVACGTGRHANMFYKWGLEVEGADISQAMIAQARSEFSENDRLRWVVRSFEEPIELWSVEDEKRPFDAAVCMGNSLALAPEEASVRKAMERMFAAVRPGGLVFVQVLNLWHLDDGPCLWQKCKKLYQTSANDSGEMLVLKGVHRCGTRGYVDFLVASAADGELLHRESVPFLGLEAKQLEEYARSAGAKQVHFFGDYQQNSYVREESVDLIMVAEK
jgi:SAM-dependent methyltransferase